MTIDTAIRRLLRLFTSVSFMGGFVSLLSLLVPNLRLSLSLD